MNTYNDNPGQTNPEDYSSELKDIIRNLHENKTLRRKGARRKLEMHGKKNPQSLVDLLKSKDQKVRWESMKALITLEDESLIPFFLDLLTDDYGDIRWISAEGLILIGRSSIVPTIRRMLEKDDSVFLREGVHHILSKLIIQNERELYDSLLAGLGNTYISGAAVKMHASELLNKLRD